jgi:hypothetical protein
VSRPAAPSSVGDASAANATAGPATRVYRWLSIPRHLVGASLLRIALGLLVLYQLLGHWGERHLLWGPRGLYPTWLLVRDRAAQAGPSFFAVGSEAAFEALLIAGVVIAILYTVGWQTRWTSLWMYALVWSLVRRNPLLLTGGDTLLLVMLPFLLFLDTGAYLSADSRWRPIGAATPTRGPFAALLHNVALGCVFLQLALFYGFAGFYKLLGESWRGGTAVADTLRLPEFGQPALDGLLLHRPPLVAALTYATLAFELSVPLLLWSRRTRWLVAAQAVLFHGFIAWSMGLVLFSAQALAFQLPLFSNRAYRAVASRLGAAGGWLARRQQRPLPAEQSGTAADSQ